MATKYEMNLVDLVAEYHSEEKCREYLETLRWPDGVSCPRCQSQKVSRIRERCQFDCDSCGHQFSVTSGTMMHDTHLPLWKWFLAVYMIVESKKGISAKQLERSLKVQYRTAWYLSHRIRAAFNTPTALLAGIVEIDETYIGGKVRGKGRGYRGNKACVVGAIQRDGKLVTEKVNVADRKTLRQFIMENVHPDAEMLCTDENPAYGDMNDHNTRHETVNHSADEWVRGDVHTNGAENAWSLFKRSVIGAFHKISHKHLDKYLDEFEFRFNNRDNPYIFRDALKFIIEAKHLEYSELVA